MQIRNYECHKNHVFYTLLSCILLTAPQQTTVKLQLKTVMLMIPDTDDVLSKMLWLFEKQNL